MWWGLDNNFIVQPQLVSLLGRADLSARAQVFLISRLLCGLADGLHMSARSFFFFVCVLHLNPVPTKEKGGTTVPKQLDEPDEHSRPGYIAEWVLFGGSPDFDFTTCGGYPSS
jgi:hypothetical protein